MARLGTARLRVGRRRVDQLRLELGQAIGEPRGVDALLVPDPGLPVADGQVIRVEVELEPAQGDLECASLQQPRMARAASPAGIVAEVEVDPVRVEVVGRLHDVVAREDLGRGEGGARNLLLGALPPPGLVVRLAVELCQALEGKNLLRSRIL